MTDDEELDLGGGAGQPATDREKIERLNAIAAEMMGCRTEREVYELTVAAAERVLAFDISGVDAVEDGWLVPQAMSAEMADVGSDRARIENGGLAGRAAETGESIVTDDVRESAIAEPDADEYRSALAVPVGDLGVFQAASRRVGAFDPADRELAELLLTHTEEALQRIRFEGALQERNRTIEQLHATAAELIGCETEAAACDLAVAAAKEVLDFRVCTVLVTVEGGTGLEVVAATDDDIAPDPDGTVVEGGENVAWATYDAGESILVDDVAESDLASPHHESYRSAISVLLGDVGVFQAIATEPGAFDDEDREMAELLASQAGEVVSRLRAERRRTDERDRLAALFDNVPDPVASVVYDDDVPVVQAVNPAFERVFGYDEGAAVGIDLDELIVPPGERDGAREVNHSNRRGESFHREVCRQTADGERREFILHAVPFDRGPGNPGGFAIYTDITDRKRREQRLDALHESARELIAADDATAVCERAVEAARETLGLEVCGVRLVDEGELVPIAWTDAAGDLFGGAPPTFGPEEAAIWRAFERDEPRVYGVQQVESADSDGAVESVLVVPLGDWGVFVSGAGNADTFTDQVVDLAGVLAATVETALSRTERERALRARERELERQNERLEEFASVVSHDLRNPLSVAQGNLELARETGDDEFFENVIAAHDRMEGLIEDLLALARGGQVVGETEPVALARAARRAWVNVDAPVATLTVDEEGEVEADADRLVQLLENLFGNAVEHGAADVDVQVRRTERGFVVTDDGAGIPESARDRVLEYGYSSEEGGTGLGLAIVRDIVEAHGWTVQVGESARGGARFDVRTG